MGVPIVAALTFTIVYHVTLNLPDLPYSHDLRRVGSEEFRTTAHKLTLAIDELFKDLPGEHRTSLVEFRYHQVLGTLAYIDIYADRLDHDLRRRLYDAVYKGEIGDFAVSTDGFVVHVVQDSNLNCSPEEFRCLNGQCIPKEQRCDKVRHCTDGSDESAKHGGCQHHLPAIYQTDRVVSVPIGGNIELSAVIDSLPENGQVVWSRNDQIIGQNSLSRTADDRFYFYHTADQYFVRIENATQADHGIYKISIEGAPAEATYEVRITPDRVPTPSSDCPEGERACKSGHCLPLSNFCDRIVQCPDGDDEESCSQVECADSEMRCDQSNVCVPLAVRCDGWKDCMNGEDEQNCPSKNSHNPGSHKQHHKGRHHHKHARVTVTCEDGSAPEFSLHGSTYCWSNSVCPTDTVCHQGLCCRTGLNSTLTRKCPASQWECLDGKCLSMDERCDGIAQCDDKGDERFCDGNEKRSVVPHTSCAAGEFRCDSGECISADKKCNRKYECRDGSDEMKCDYYIAAREFHKSNGTVRQTSETSQSPPHSTHPSTQSQSTSQPQPHHSQTLHPSVTLSANDLECTDQEFRCPYLPETKCFHYDKLCDGIDDCDNDGSDETNCESGSREEPQPAGKPQNDKGGCSSHEFTCGNGKCIDKRLMCNRKYDCDDGTDETTCDYYKESMKSRDRQTTAAQPRSNQIGGEQGEKGNQPQQNGAEDARRREAELQRREEELRRREHEDRRREEELRRREGDERRREGEERRREEENRRREEEERRRESQLRAAQQQRSEHIARPNVNGNGIHQWRQPSAEVTFDDDYTDGEDDLSCQEHEFQCSTGECIDKRRLCDTRPDCIDASDEENCADRRVNGNGGPVPPPPGSNFFQPSVSTDPPRLPPPPTYPPRQPIMHVQPTQPSYPAQQSHPAQPREQATPAQPASQPSQHRHQQVHPARPRGRGFSLKKIIEFLSKQLTF